MDKIRSAVTSGRFPAGRFLPPVRELSSEYGVSPETIRRGLKILEREKLVAAKARQGFRVSSGAGAGADAARHCPVAYVTSHDAYLTGAQPANLAILDAFQRTTAQAGSSVLGVHSAGAGGAVILEQLRAGRAWGAALDTMDRALLEALRGSGLPLVLINSCWEDAEVDVVIQDNYRGGFLAARHLLDSGCRRIAWFGALGRFYHSRERFAGAVAALAAAGMRFDEALCADVEGPEASAKAAELLDRSDRPDGVLAFSAGAMQTLARAAQDRGLGLGAGLRAVGWTVEEGWAGSYRPLFGAGPVPPAVVWKASSMVERAMTLLAERRAGRGGEPVRVCVPARLSLTER
ncbi:MAG TPA: GntR family transcriptional regulator [Planctomycetota bacterium]|nr:GntR family transcriptional regulator [Planctomycetota bacterium]